MKYKKTAFWASFSGTGCSLLYQALRGASLERAEQSSRRSLPHFRPGHIRPGSRRTYFPSPKCMIPNKSQAKVLTIAPRAPSSTRAKKTNAKCMNANKTQAKIKPAIAISKIKKKNENIINLNENHQKLHFLYPKSFKIY